MRASIVGLLAVAACSAESGTPPAPVEGLEGLSEGLSDLSAQCTYTSGTRTVALALVSDDIAWIAKGAGGAIEVNGIACGAALVTSTGSIQVTTSGAGDQTLILDRRTGAFGLGTVNGPGVAIDLGGEAVGDKVKLIGSPGVDAYVFGALGIAIDADTRIDVTLTGVEDVAAHLDDGNDTFSAAGNATTGSAFAQALTIYGGAGDDTIRGGAGSDSYFGGDGNDRFTTDIAADGGDVMNGGEGTDTADYSARTTAIAASVDGVANDGATGELDDIAGDVEILKGGGGGDTLTGGSNSESLYGGLGDDTLAGGGGDDLLYGDAGDDLFDEGSAANGADSFDGGAGVDTVAYSGRAVAVTIKLDAMPTSGATGEHDRALISVENARGGGGNDTIVGSSAANVLDGAGGNDMIDGSGGDDTLRGGTGTNALAGGSGDDRFDQGATATGDDTLAGGTGVDVVDYAGRSTALMIIMNGCEHPVKRTRSRARARRGWA